jgi:hypothetical protein
LNWENKCKNLLWNKHETRCPSHQRQGPLFGAHKTYTKPSTPVKYVIKFVGTANPITNFKFAEEYVENNKQNKHLIFIFPAHPIPNLDYVSRTRFNCVVITKPFKYLNYEEDYVSTAYVPTYLDFVVATQSISSQWGNKCGHYKI